MDEQALANRVAGGEVDALADYLTVVRERLLAYIQRQLGAGLRRKVEPEDIFQETSAEALRSLDQIDFSQRDPFSWLCHLAQRRIIDAHRHFFAAKKRAAGREVALQGGGGDSDQGGLINMLVASMTTPSAAFSRNVKQARVAEAIGELPEQQQTALRMRYVEGRPSKEIAEAIGKSDAAVRVMLTRAIKKLQDALGVAEPTPEPGEDR